MIRFNRFVCALTVLILFGGLVVPLGGCASPADARRMERARRYNGNFNAIMSEFFAWMDATSETATASASPAEKRAFVIRQREELATQIKSLLYRMDCLPPAERLGDVHSAARALLEYIGKASHQYAIALRSGKKESCQQVEADLHQNLLPLKKRLVNALEKAGRNARGIGIRDSVQAIDTQVWFDTTRRPGP